MVTWLTLEGEQKIKYSGNTWLTFGTLAKLENSANER